VLVAVLMSAALVVAASTSKKLKLRMKDLKRSAYVAFAASLIAGIALVPSAGASGVFKISNTSHSATVGTSITVKTTGGSGSGAVTFSVSGMNCTIGAKSGVLSASAATTCSVKATKAASKGNKAQTSSASFSFTAPVTTTTTTMPTTTTTTPAKSSDSPTPSTPDVATLTSVTGASSAQINDTANGDAYFIDQYYNANDHWYAYYITPGATVTLNWHVNGSNGSPLANAPVTLLGNLDYSCDPGVKWTTTSLDANPGCNSGTQGSLSGTTDSSGNVSFTITDADTASTTAATDQTTTAGVATNEASGSAFPWTDMVLQVGSDIFTASPNTTVNQGTDRVDFIVSPAPTPQSSVVSVTPTPAADTTAPSFSDPDVAVLTSITGNNGPILNGTPDGDGGGTGWIPTYYHQGDRWLMSYMSAGGSVTLNWLVTGTAGQPLPNKPVTLISNIAYSGSCGVTWSSSALNVGNNCYSGNSTQGSLAGTTNAHGVVSFTLNDTNTSAACTETYTPLVAEADEGAGSSWGCNFSAVTLVIGSDSISAGSSTNEVTDRIDVILSPNPTVTEAPTYYQPDVATLTSFTGTTGTPVNSYSALSTAVFGGTIGEYYHFGNAASVNYVHAGSTLNVTYHVTGSNGQPLANTAVYLMDNLAGSCATGSDTTGVTFTSGTTGGTTTTFGAYTGLNSNPNSAAASGQCNSYWWSGGSLQGTTDASGNVTFTLVVAAQSSGCTITSSAANAISEETGSCAWTRMTLQVGSDVWSGDNYAEWGGPQTNEISDLADLLVVP
jgi:protocatechuate 3,4-dioxygenase beta subunit